MSEFPVPDREEIEDVLQWLDTEAKSYLASVDDRPVRHDETAALAALDQGLPEYGAGALATLRTLVEQGRDATVTSSGPRCFHFVIGGSTPAALGADMLAPVWDQIAYAWVTSPLAVQLEVMSLRWLRELFELPAEWTGVMTTGATMANFTCLAAARQWWGERHGVDVGNVGLTGLPAPIVLTSELLHASSYKALAMLGIGRGAVATIPSDHAGALDLGQLEQSLLALDGTPAIVIANAGEVNAGAFDPIVEMADLAHRFDCWLHVDGAFGLFARVSPRTAHLAAGAERAHSVTVDGHKWLNVPYDAGFAFVADEPALTRAFRYTGDYLPGPDDPRPVLGTVGPESSRRARSLAVWATLRAYGRAGYRAIVEQHLDLAQRMATAVDRADDLERLAEVHLNIVCFRYNPGGLDPAELDRYNTALGEAIISDGRVYAGTTRHAGRVALRPAIVNWRTRAADVDLFVDVVRELAARIHPEH